MLNFPSSPTVGQTYAQFVWSGEAWIGTTVAAGGGDITSVTAGAGMSGGGSSGDVTLTSTLATSGGTIGGNTTISGNMAAGSAYTIPSTNIPNIFTGVVTATNYCSGGYFNGGWKHYSSGSANFNLLIMDNNINFFTAPSGAADSAITTTERFRINNSDGQCYNTSGSWTSLSDRSIKQDIHEYPRGLQEICALSPVYFTYIPSATSFAGEGEEQIVRVGLLADEVAQVLPEVCGTTTVFAGEDAREIATLQPTLLIYSLIGAIKTLSARVEALEQALPPLQPDNVLQQ